MENLTVMVTGLNDPKGCEEETVKGDTFGFCIYSNFQLLLKVENITAWMFINKPLFERYVRNKVIKYAVANLGYKR